MPDNLRVKKLEAKSDNLKHSLVHLEVILITLM